MQTRQRTKLIISDVRSLAVEPHEAFFGFETYVVCEICFGLFYSTDECERHKESCRSLAGDMNFSIGGGVGGPPIQCHACTASFANAYEYSAHYREKHFAPQDVHFPSHSLQPEPPKPATSNQPFACSRCDQRFSLKTLLRDHQIRDHPNIYRAYACRHNGCGRKFFNHEEYTRHLHTAHRLDFVCEYCKMSYASREGLTQHIRSHTGEKPFKCEHCGRSFAVKDYLVKHIRTHTGEKPYKCENGCGARFTQPSPMNIHMKRSCPAVKGRCKRGRPRGNENRVPQRN